MKKLTSELCKDLINDLQSMAGFCISSTKEGYLQALEIALPILEQQDHEKSIIAGQLEAVRDSLSLTPHQDAVISCAIDRLNVLTSRNIELSSSLIKQQERDEGEWIEWSGGECPVPPGKIVDLKLRKGSITTNYPAGSAQWDHRSEDNDTDIMAYRVVNP